MKDSDLIVKQFIEHALIMEQSQYSGDYKKGNKSHEVHLAIRDRLNQEPELAKEVFDELFLNDNTYILYAISVYALVLKYRTDKAIKTLEDIASMDDNGLTSFHAKTALELYESGELFELHEV